MYSLCKKLNKIFWMLSNCILFFFYKAKQNTYIHDFSKPQVAFEIWEAGFLKHAESFRYDFNALKKKKIFTVFG